jgi:acetyl esterase/lipase
VRAAGYGFAHYLTGQDAGRQTPAVHHGGVTDPVPFDAELQAYLDRLPEGSPGPMTAQRLPRLRASDAGEVPPREELARGGRFDVRETTVDGVPLVVCSPAGAEGPVPVLYYTHGGGMFSGDPRVDLGPLLDEAEAFGAALVSVGYRLAPEHPYPAQIDDVRAGLEWVARQPGFDASRIVAAGTSAGGALTAALALTVRDRGGPRLLGQLLLCPMLDDRGGSFSLRQQDGHDTFDVSWNDFAWTALLGEARGGPDVSPYAAPARARDLSGLPPTYIDVGSAESLRDECVGFANRIWQAGGDAELHVWPGGFHIFDLWVTGARLTTAARSARHSWLARLLT